MKTRLLYVVMLTLATGLALAQDKAKAGPDESAKARAAIQKYVETDQKLKGGFFLKDAKTDKIRDLKFEKVHAAVEKVNNQYVACVDFTDRNGERLDLDFQLEPAQGGDLKVSEVKIHKVDGAKR